MSQVHEPIRVGATGGGGCGCGLGIHNPSPTHTRDMGSRVLPVSVIESHTVVYNHIKCVCRKFKAPMEHFGGIDTTRGQEYMVRLQSFLFFLSTDYYNIEQCHDSRQIATSFSTPPMDPASQINVALTWSV